MNDLLVDPRGLPLANCERRQRARATWRPRWSSNFAFFYLLRSSSSFSSTWTRTRGGEKKESKRKRERERERRRERESVRFTIQKSGVWLRDIKMCWLYVAAVPRARGVVKKTHDLLIRRVVKRWDVRSSAISRMTPVTGHHDDYGHDNDASDDVCLSSRRDPGFSTRPHRWRTGHELFRTFVDLEEFG